MSQRYVWSKSNVVLIEAQDNLTYEYEDSYTRFIDVYENFPIHQALNNEAILSEPLYASYGTSYTFENGKYKITNQTNVNPTEYGDGYYKFSIGLTGTSQRRIYLGFAKTTSERASGYNQIYYLTFREVSGFGFGYAPEDTNILEAFSAGGSITGGSGSLWLHTQGSKGTSVGTVSNASSGAYPADGTSGNYWYELQGNDNIDASAVGYNTQQPRGGQPITITVTPSAGNVYGGTVRYTYQVQLAGGAWQTISSNNTATSLQYTIPAGTATFAARVLASDTWGFSSTTYTTGATLAAINNNPPSAPNGINIGAVLGGEQCTITWGAATDADGTIASYQLERQIDNGDTWTQIYTGLALTYDDTINSEWATVNYRVRAVDDDGAAGPYTTGTMQTVNAGWLYFSGPPEDMGDKPAPFTFAFSIGSTTEGTTDISVAVLLDDENIYTGTPDAGEQVSLEIDTRLSYEGEHTIVVSFEKANLLGDQYIGTYNVPAIEIPDGGHAVQLYNSDGEPVFPNTFARQVFAQKGDSAAKIFDRYFSGTYTGTGTSGAVNPCSIRLSFVPRFLFVYSPNGNAWGFWIRTAEPTVAAQGTMATNAGSCTVQWDNENMILSWYGSSASVQLNVSGTAYGYVVTG